MKTTFVNNQDGWWGWASSYDYLTSYKEHIVNKSNKRSVESIIKKAKYTLFLKLKQKRYFGEKWYLITLLITYHVTFYLLRYILLITLHITYFVITYHVTFYLLRYLLLFTLLCNSFSLVSAIIVAEHILLVRLLLQKSAPCYC